MPHEDCAARLLVALQQQDDVALAGLLNGDVHLVVDSGDETGGELRGRVRVIREVRRRLAMHPDAVLHPVHVNGRAGLALRRHDGEVIGVLNIEGAASIETLWVTTSLVKLRHWNRRRPEID